MLARCRFGLLLLVALSLPAQQPDSFVSTGRITENGASVPYVIRHLPVSSFPELPVPVAAELTRRGCLIPQTYEAHGPENVIHGSFERPGSQDWAVLCSAGGKVSLLVFFASAPTAPATLASAAETGRLQPHPGHEEWSFNWGIDRATRAQVYEAQNGLEPHPPVTDHDSVADSVIDHKTVYHFYSNGAWSELPLPE